MCEEREVHFVTKLLQESVMDLGLLATENLSKIIEMLKLNKKKKSERSRKVLSAQLMCGIC